MGFRLDAHEATIWDGGDSQFSCSHRKTIGATVAAVLRQAESSKNRYVYTSSFETSQNEILHCLKSSTNADWTVQSVRSEDMIRQGREGFSQGNFIEMGKLALAASYSGLYGGNFQEDGKLANEEFGIPQEKLNEVVAEVVQRYQTRNL